MMYQKEVGDGFYDCHLHIPVKSKEPIAELFKEIDNSNVRGFVLILNSMKEENLYLGCIRAFEKYNYKVAFLLDIKSEVCLEKFKKLENGGGNYIAKLHPRISNITKDDFCMVKEKLDRLSCRVVIVDDWIFGHRIENHIGTELAMYLAEELPDKTVVIAHGGGYKIVETMLLTRPLKNIYYDLSVTQQYFRGSSIELDIDYFVSWTSERILFGSDYPSFGIREAWLSFKQHYHNAGIADRLQVSSKLAQSVYGLK